MFDLKELHVDTNQVIFGLLASYLGLICLSYVWDAFMIVLGSFDLWISVLIYRSYGQGRIATLHSCSRLRAQRNYCLQPGILIKSARSGI